MSKQTVTISIESETWHLFQKHCIDNMTKPSRLIQRFMEKTCGFAANGKSKKPRLSAQQEAQLLLKKLTEQLALEGEEENGN